MPALVKRRVGSERGTTEDEGTAIVSHVVYVLCTWLRLTKRVAILLEVVQEGLAHACSAPFVLLVD
jgi:hypothetical protein